MAAVNPYLNFSGNCDEAFDFYKSVFGGEFTSKMRFKDVPSDVQMEGEKIMHMSLPIGRGTSLMGSDRPGSMGPTVDGTNFYIAIAPETQEETERLFNGLSAGGNVFMPLDKTFWGAYFGMFTDKFGIQWMVNYELNPQQ
jgi:PhnB protein